MESHSISVGGEGRSFDGPAFRHILIPGNTPLIKHMNAKKESNQGPHWGHVRLFAEGLVHVEGLVRVVGEGHAPILGGIHRGLVGRLDLLDDGIENLDLR